MPSLAEMLALYSAGGGAGATDPYQQQPTAPLQQPSVDDLMAAPELPQMPAPQLSMPEMTPPNLQGDASGTMPAPGGQPLGHPDVLAKAKELIEKTQAQNPQPATPRGTGLKSETIKSEEGGPSPAQRAEGVAAQGQYELDTGAIQQNRLHEQADQLEQQAKQLRVQAAAEDEARHKQETENAARQQRLREQQMQLAEQKDEPIDAKRYFSNMSLFGKVSAIISAFSYGYLNPHGGSAPIIGDLMQMAKEDVNAQIQNRSANREQRHDVMDQYERQYGDTTLVAKRLEADKLLTMAKQANAEAKEAKSTEAKGAASDLGQQLQAKADLLHEQIQQATYAKPVEVTRTFAPNAGKLAGEAALKKALELDKTLEERGYTPEQRQAALKAMGVPLPQGPSAPASAAAERAAKDKAEAGKRNDDQAKAHSAMDALDQYGKNVGLPRAADGGYDVDKAGRVNWGAAKEGLGSIVGGAEPQAAARRVAIEAIGRLESGGAISKDESVSFGKMLGGAQSPKQIAEALNAIRTIVEPRMHPQDAAAEEDKKRLEGSLAPKPVTGRYTP